METELKNCFGGRLGAISESLGVQINVSNVKVWDGGIICSVRVGLICKVVLVRCIDKTLLLLLLLLSKSLLARVVLFKFCV